MILSGPFAMWQVFFCYFCRLKLIADLDGDVLRMNEKKVWEGVSFPAEEKASESVPG